jgi:hypothetical protein
MSPFNRSLDPTTLYVLYHLGCVDAPFAPLRPSALQRCSTPEAILSDITDVLLGAIAMRVTGRIGRWEQVRKATPSLPNRGMPTADTIDEWLRALAASADATTGSLSEWVSGQFARSLPRKPKSANLDSTGVLLKFVGADKAKALRRVASVMLDGECTAKKAHMAVVSVLAAAPVQVPKSGSFLAVQVLMDVWMARGVILQHLGVEHYAAPGTGAKEGLSYLRHALRRAFNTASASAAAAAAAVHRSGGGGGGATTQQQRQRLEADMAKTAKVAAERKMQLKDASDDTVLLDLVVEELTKRDAKLVKLAGYVKVGAERRKQFPERYGDGPSHSSWMCPVTGHPLGTFAAEQGCCEHSHHIARTLESSGPSIDMGAYPWCHPVTDEMHEAMKEYLPLTYAADVVKSAKQMLTAMETANVARLPTVPRALAAGKV